MAKVQLHFNEHFRLPLTEQSSRVRVHRPYSPGLREEINKSEHVTNFVCLGSSLPCCPSSQSWYRNGKQMHFRLNKCLCMPLLLGLVCCWVFLVFPTPFPCDVSCGNGKNPLQKERQICVCPYGRVKDFPLFRNAIQAINLYQNQ